MISKKEYKIKVFKMFEDDDILVNEHGRVINIILDANYLLFEEYDRLLEDFKKSIKQD